MSNGFAHLSSDDPFGLAVDDVVILNSLSGGRRVETVETMTALGRYLAAAAKDIKPVEEFSVEYELYSGTLTVPLGVLIGDAEDMLVTALSASSDSLKRPTVSLTGIRFSATDKLLPSLTAGVVASALSIDIAGGFGLVNKWGVTGTINGISSSMSIAMQSAERLAETSGDYLANGFVQFGFKQNVTIESFVAAGTGSTVPGVSDAKNVIRDKKTGKQGWETHSLTFFRYLGLA